MEWVEVALRVNAAISEPITDIFYEIGYQGVAVERDGIPPDQWDEGTLPPATHYTIRAYLPVDDTLQAVQRQLEAALARYTVEQPVYRNIAEEDWSEAWKRHYHALRIGRHIIVRPAWETADTLTDADLEIVLDPGMAFGTGTHPTTQLCLAAMEDLAPLGADVIDLGCGSGILAIAAAKLGAGSVYGIDVDPVAVEAAAENIARNGVAAQIELATGGLPEVLAHGRRFDFAAVNILARVIVQMCALGLGDILKPSGRAIFTGLIESQVDEVEAALRDTGLTPLQRRQQGDWVLIEAIRAV